MKARSRRSRLVTRVTMFAAAALFSTSLSTPVPALAAGRAHAIPFPAASSPSRLPESLDSVGLVPPAAHRHRALRPHAVKDFAGVSQTHLSAGVRAGFSAVVLVAGIGLVGALGAWLLEFVGRSSRTRGQPRAGALAT